VLLVLILWGALILGFSLSRSLALSCVLIFLIGGALMISLSMVSSLVQAVASDAMRGRVMSVFNVAFRGGMPIGSLMLGRLIPMFTAPLTMAWTGCLLAVLGIYFLFIHRRVAEL
jgi:predicted MFS family arabinose efflux permease